MQEVNPAARHCEAIAEFDALCSAIGNYMVKSEPITRKVDPLLIIRLRYDDLSCS